MVSSSQPLNGDRAPKRSILKQSSSQSFEPVQGYDFLESNFQLPSHPLSKDEILDANNTTSRINTLKLQNKVNRRVSFAPDVTLHSFDFVPDSKSSNRREPRRKPHDDIVTSTQKNEPNTPIPDTGHSMEMAGIIQRPLKSSTAESKLEEGKANLEYGTHQDIPSSLPVIESEHEEYSDNVDDRNAESMEFTGPQEVLDTQVEPLQSTQEDMSMTGIQKFDESHNSKNVPTEEHNSFVHGKAEEPMELTGTFNVLSKPDVSDTAESQPMDITEISNPQKELEGVIVSPSASQPMELTQIMGTVPKATVEEISQGNMDFTQVFSKPQTILKEPPKPELRIQSGPDISMDLTGVMDKSYNPSSVENIDNKNNDNINQNVEEEGEVMEFTQPVEKKIAILPTSQVINNDVQDDDDDAMDLTRISFSNLPVRGKEAVDRRKSLIPTSNKRRKLNNDELFIHPNATPIPIEEQEEMELTSMERMSPIRYEDMNDSSKMNSQIPSLETKEKDRGNVTYSLREFLDKTDVSFLIDPGKVKLKDKKITFMYMDSNSSDISLPINKLYNALYVDVPVLEMNAFICKELFRKISQSKQSFEDLETQISSSVPPLLLKEYFTSSEEMKKLMNDQMQLVKMYSKLEAKKAWYEWRKLHLNGIKNVLIENLALLQEELERTKSSLQKLYETRKRIEEIKDSLKYEVKLLKEMPPNSVASEPTLEDKVKLASLKQELIAHKITLESLPDLQKKNDAIRLEIEEKTNKLSKLKEELSHLDTEDNTTTALLEKGDITVLSAKLKYLEKMLHVRATRFVGSLLTLEFDLDDGLIELTINISNIGQYRTKSIEIAENVLLYRPLLECYLRHVESIISKKSVHTVTDFFFTLYVYMRKFSKLLKEYNLLKMVFPVKVIEQNDKETIFEIEDFDFNNRNKYIYHLSMKSFINAVFNDKSVLPIEVKIMKGSQITSNVLSSRLIQKGRKVLPWLDKSRVTITII
ncbi:kinetochore-microtubule binding complex subunit SPC105 NDAI_0I01280 [Naumovozyma dairenensis CBS 421]|uniref:Spc7 kinetochore protein domain-containing protein n=1 Tax=Naumovozyma dairenensis (strain ATCC 10597 / BCRC 20456 / CBS 421 / NBRC 0211 / NRRL Y-12639) TaxID=1071378 RepID=G0WFY6_NAUDC|nr:hypothetical protein NDAI_0I01280 [Naumovozyma dairenensis CBS 421]CCD26697.1 hypothetical protein NDAI_0I01280 [Naumovozyma dairenensis CBS 421]